MPFFIPECSVSIRWCWESAVILNQVRAGRFYFIFNYIKDRELLDWSRCSIIIISDLPEIVSKARVNLSSKGFVGGQKEKKIPYSIQFIQQIRYKSLQNNSHSIRAQ